MTHGGGTIVNGVGTPGSTTAMRPREKRGRHVTSPWPYHAADDWRERVEAALKGTFVLERELRAGSTNRVFVGSETALGRRVVIRDAHPWRPRR